MPVRYVPGSESQVHAEFEGFFLASPNEAADSLAVLHHVAVAGFGGLDDEHRDGFGMARPYCHQSAGWGVFFEIAGPWGGPCSVTLLLVAEFARAPIDDAKSEAIRRWDAATAGRTGP